MRTRHGFRVSGSTEDLIQRRIFQFGTWEPELTSLMKSRVSAGDVVIDVGANIGYFTMLAASLVGPKGRVIAFEPTPSLAHVLSEHLAANGFNNVDLHAVALGDHNDTVTIYRAPGGNSGRSGLSAGVGFVSEGEVPCVVGAERIPKELWSQVSFVKIDVEGAEQGVVSGLLPVFEALPKNATIVVEISVADKGTGPTIDHPIVAEISGLGFTCEFLPNDYTHAEYLAAAPKGPSPLPAVLRKQIDVVFTKH